jgi:hypothetical protein
MAARHARIAFTMEIYTSATWVGLGGPGPPTSSLSGIIGHWRYVLRLMSAGRSVCPLVAVTIP